MPKLWHDTIAAHRDAVRDATLDVTAPDTREQLGPEEQDAASGCNVASGAYSAVGLVPALAMMLLFSGRHRRSRVRRVDGALAR